MKLTRPVTFESGRIMISFWHIPHLIFHSQRTVFPSFLPLQFILTIAHFPLMGIEPFFSANSKNVMITAWLQLQIF